MREIIEGARTAAKLKLTTIELLVRLDPMPRLGRYKKRSAEQTLWRLASDADAKPAERWAAIKTLLAAAVKATQVPEAAGGGPG